MTAFKHSLELIINPFFMLFLALLLSTMLLKSDKNRLIRILLIGVCALLVLCSTGWLPKYLTERLEAQYPVLVQPSPEVKWVVVLGGGHFDVDDMPANNLLTGASIKRLVEGVRLLRQLPHARLILSGGGESPIRSEAVLLQQISQWFSIAKDKIVLEAAALNTQEQAKALVHLVHKEPFYLVTSAIHMPRALFLCKQLGMHPIAAPTDYTFVWHDSNKARMIIPNVYNFFYFTIAMHELLGRVWAGLDSSP